jgi:hypothetical protein
MKIVRIEREIHEKGIIGFGLLGIDIVMGRSEY